MNLELRSPSVELLISFFLHCFHRLIEVIEGRAVYGPAVTHKLLDGSSHFFKKSQIVDSALIFFKLQKPGKAVHSFSDSSFNFGFQHESPIILNR